MRRATQSLRRAVWHRRRIAPFCTMALADSLIERDLGLDGAHEVVLYAARVGVRPAGGYVQWPARPPGRTYVSPDRDG